MHQVLLKHVSVAFRNKQKKCQIAEEQKFEHER